MQQYQSDIYLSFEEAQQKMKKGEVVEWRLDRYRMISGLLFKQRTHTSWIRIEITEEMKNTHWVQDPNKKYPRRVTYGVSIS